MPWDDITRKQHNRDGLRYPSDLTDRERAVVAPLVPPARPGGRPRTTDMREVMNAILCIVGGGIPWRIMPRNFPPASTVRGYFYAWRDLGLFQTINHVLVAATRELEGREASPMAGVIDSQSVKTTDSGGVSGYDAGKKVKGCKRHILTVTLGLMLVVLVHSADIQDRDDAPHVLKAIRCRFPWLRHVFSDDGYAGQKLLASMEGNGAWTIQIIKRSDTAKGFEILPRRWVAERTFAWLGRCRRLAKDWEKSVESSRAWAYNASIRIIIRRLATYCFVS